MSKRMCPDCGGDGIVLEPYRLIESCDVCPQGDRDPMCNPYGDDEYDECMELFEETCLLCMGKGVVVWKTELFPDQIVQPHTRRWTAEYVAMSRVGLLHILNLATGRCYCGRSADNWNLPYRTHPEEMEALQAELTSEDGDRYFCRQCRRAWLAEQEANDGQT